LVNEYLGYLADRNYSPRTVRAYGFDLLAFCRWLAGEEIGLDAVTTEVVLEFLRACREATLPGQARGQCGVDDWAAAGPVCSDHDQPSAGCGDWAFRVLADAGS